MRLCSRRGWVGSYLRMSSSVALPLLLVMKRSSSSLISRACRHLLLRTCDPTCKACQPSVRRMQSRYVTLALERREEAGCLRYNP